MSKCFPNSFAIPAAISEAGRSCEALRMDISARCVGSGCGSREVCRLLRGSAGGLSGCGKAGIVEFPLGGIDER